MSSKTVVIIGAGIFGIAAANRLAKSGEELTIKLISLSNYTAFICSTIRVPVDNDPKGTIFEIKQVVSPKVELIIDEVVDIKKENIILKKGGDLLFDSLIIATGSKWNDPIVSTHEFKDDFAKYYEAQYQKIKEAKHIVLIGGGFNNLELIGELIHHYKDELKQGKKQITLVHNGELVLPDIEKYTHKIRKSTTDYLTSYGNNVNIVLNSKAVVLDGGKSVQITTKDKEQPEIITPDLIFSSVGVVPSTPPHASLSNFVDEHNFIKVLDSFQSSNPEYSNIFSIGDVNNIQYKGLVHRSAWLNVLSANVLSVLKGETGSLKTIVKPTGNQACVVSLGPEHAYGQFPVPLIGTVTVPTWVCVKAKASDLFKSQAEGIFHS